MGQGHRRFPYDLVIVSNKGQPEIPRRHDAARSPAADAAIRGCQAAQSATPLLELDDVCKSFGRVVVADRTSRSRSAGEALGVVGPNGAGKTSMLNLVTGNLAPGLRAHPSSTAGT